LPRSRPCEILRTATKEPPLSSIFQFFFLIDAVLQQQQILHHHDHDHHHDDRELENRSVMNESEERENVN